MPETAFVSVRVGDELPVVEKPPITRITLALFCGASNDHNPIHVDSDYARAAGQPDVFAHGMLVMAYLGQALTGWAPQSAIHRYSVRFCAITHLGDAIICKAKVIEIIESDGKQHVRLQMDAVNQHGEIKLTGEALVAPA